MMEDRMSEVRHLQFLEGLVSKTRIKGPLTTINQEQMKLNCSMVHAETYQILVLPIVPGLEPPTINVRIVCPPSHQFPRMLEDLKAWVWFLQANLLLMVALKTLLEQNTLRNPRE